MSFTQPLPSPPLLASPLPTPPTTPSKPGKVKKMVASLKRRGSKILSRRTSSSSNVAPPSPRAARSRSPSPVRPDHRRARTTSLVFTSLRLPGRKTLARASSARSLRSDDTAVSSTEHEHEHVRTPSTATSFSYTRDKLALDVDDAVLLSPKAPLATIVSAVEESEPYGYHMDMPVPAVEPMPEASSPEELEAPVHSIPEGAVVAMPEPVVAEEPVVEEPAPAVVAPEAPAPEAVAVPALAVVVPAPAPNVVTPAPEPAPKPAFVPSWSEYDEYRDIPAFVLPTLLPARALLACALNAPFFTLTWWLHPLVPLV